MIFLIYILIFWAMLGAAWVTHNTFLHPEKVAAAYVWNQSNFLPFWNHPKLIFHKVIILGVIIYGLTAIFSFWWCVSYFMPFPHGGGYIGGRIVFSLFLAFLNLGVLSIVKHLSYSIEQNETLQEAQQKLGLTHSPTSTSHEPYPYKKELAKLEGMETT